MTGKNRFKKVAFNQSPILINSSLLAEKDKIKSLNDRIAKTILSSKAERVVSKSRFRPVIKPMLPPLPRPPHSKRYF